MRLIEEQLAKRAAAAETASNAKLDLAAQAVTNVDKAKAAGIRRKSMSAPSLPWEWPLGAIEPCCPN